MIQFGRVPERQQGLLGEAAEEAGLGNRLSSAAALPAVCSEQRVVLLFTLCCITNVRCPTPALSSSGICSESLWRVWLPGELPLVVTADFVFGRMALVVDWCSRYKHAHTFSRGYWGN